MGPISFSLRAVSSSEALFSRCELSRQECTFPEVAIFLSMPATIFSTIVWGRIQAPLAYTNFFPVDTSFLAHAPHHPLNKLYTWKHILLFPQQRVSLFFFGCRQRFFFSILTKLWTFTISSTSLQCCKMAWFLDSISDACSFAAFLVAKKLRPPISTRLSVAMRLLFVRRVLEVPLPVLARFRTKTMTTTTINAQAIAPTNGMEVLKTSMSGWDDDNDLAGVFAPAISSLDVISSTIVITNRSLHSKYYLKHRISAVRATNIRTTTQKHESAKDAKDSAYLSLRSDWPKLGVDAAKQLNMGPSTLIVIIDFFVRDIKLENTLMILYDACVAHGMRTMSYKTVWWSFSVI